MWPRYEWLRRAEALGLVPNGRRRIECDCGGGRTLLVSLDSDGYRAHCFREGVSDRAPPPAESLAVKLARIAKAREHDIEVRSSPLLPAGGTTSVDEWPPAAYLWFLKAGLSRHDIGRLGAQYHPPSNRVVLPVLTRSTGRVDFWQARSIDGRQPKYLAPDADRTRVIPQWGHADSVTLTEDILSAYKVGLVAEGWSMLGTKLNDHTLGELMLRHKQQPGFHVNVWLDNDLPPLHSINRGQVAAAKVLATLRAVGIPARNIVSTLDPKLTSRSEIKELLHVLPN